MTPRPRPPKCPEGIIRIEIHPEAVSVAALMVIRDVVNACISEARKRRPHRRSPDGR